VALRDFWGMDNLPTNPTTTQTAMFLRPDIQSAGNAYSASATLVKTATNWLAWTGYTIPYPGTGYGGYSIYMQFPYQNISDFTTRRSFIGFRITTASQSGLFLFLKNTAGTQQNLLQLSQLALNTAQWVDIMIDRTNTQIVVWIDGVQQAPVFFDFNAFVAADGNAQLWWYPTGGSGQNVSIRDVYFIDDTQDSTLCNRLGPVDVRAASLLSVSAPNWISSDSNTALGDLSTGLGATTALQVAPTLTESPSMDPVTMQFSNTGLVASETILGFKGDISALRTASYAFAPKMTLKYNGQTVNGKTLTYPNGAAMVFNQNAWVAEKAPDGSVWTPASLAAAQVVLTP
jgi:hypothetical protein